MALRVGSFAEWDSSGGTARGQIDLIVNDRDVPGIPVKVTGTEDDPAARLTVWEERSDGWAPTDTKVGHKLSELREIDPLPRASDALVIPNYRKSTSDRQCINCDHSEAMPGVLMCEAYRVQVYPDYICDAWEMDEEEDAAEITNFPKQGDNESVRLENSRYDRCDEDSVKDRLYRSNSATIVRSPDQSVFELLKVGMPSETQLTQINQFLPYGMQPYEASELIVFPVLASHNLVSMSGGAWNYESLMAMAKDYPGKPLILDHNWDDSEKILGMVFSAHLLELDRSMVPSEVMGGANAAATNQQVLERSNFLGLLLEVAVEAKHPIVQALRYKRVDDVSTGGMTSGEMICPACGHNYFSAECPHFLSIYMSAEEKKSAIEAGYQLIDYVIRSGFHTAIELSFCVSGNLPGARVLNQKMVQEMMGDRSASPLLR